MNGDVIFGSGGSGSSNPIIDNTTVSGGISSAVLFTNTSLQVDNDANLTWDGSTLNVTGAMVATSATYSLTYVIANALEGDRGYDTTTKTQRAKDKLGDYAIRGCLDAQIVDGSANASSNAELAFYASAVSFPANALKAKRYVEVKYWGQITTAASTPGTLTIKPKLGSNVLGTLTTATLPTSLSAAAFCVTLIFTIDDDDSSGGCRGVCLLDIEQSTGVPFTKMIRFKATGIDFTAAEDLTCTGTFSASTNSLTPEGRAVIV